MGGKHRNSGNWGSGYGFFFQAEDGIRDLTVTEVQTFALPICYAQKKRGCFVNAFSAPPKIENASEENTRK